MSGSRRRRRLCAHPTASTSSTTPRKRQCVAAASKRRPSDIFAPAPSISSLSSLPEPVSPTQLPSASTPISSPTKGRSNLSSAPSPLPSTTTTTTTATPASSVHRFALESSSSTSETSAIPQSSRTLYRQHDKPSRAALAAGRTSRAARMLQAANKRAAAKQSERQSSPPSPPPPRRGGLSLADAFLDEADAVLDATRTVEHPAQVPLLPLHYHALVDIFVALDTVAYAAIRGGRSFALVDDQFLRAVQGVYRARRVTLRDIARVLYIFPEAFEVGVQRRRRMGGSGRVTCALKLTPVLANVGTEQEEEAVADKAAEDVEISHLSRTQAVARVAAARSRARAAVQRHTIAGSNDALVRRRQTFVARLHTMVDSYLLQYVEGGRGATQGRAFDVERHVPPVPCAALPTDDAEAQEAAEAASTANLSSHQAQMMQLRDRRLALDEGLARDELCDPEDLRARHRATTLSAKRLSPLKGFLRSVDPRIVDAARRREARQSEDTRLGGPAKRARLALARKLPRLFDAVRALLTTQRRRAMPYRLLAQQLSRQSRELYGDARHFESLMAMLVESVPEWCALEVRGRDKSRVFKVTSMAANVGRFHDQLAAVERSCRAALDGMGRL